MIPHGPGDDRVRWLHRLARRNATAVLGLAVLCAAVLGGPAAPVRLRAEEAEAAYAEPAVTDAQRQHWSFQPLNPGAVPSTPDNQWRRNEIDAFVSQPLQTRNLRPQPSADKTTLIRRLSYDLTGLPPTPQEIDDFIEDHDEQAYERLAERLLSSPHYGQRWAQHWLDLARFAETDGFEHDKLRPDAWKYRDWVVNALNDDMPYDEFIRLQIAGDEIDPDSESASTATRFCLSGPDMPDLNLIEERRHTVLNELVAMVGEVVLGLQVGCAQCHDHKFDPISQADFYRLRAVFEPAVLLEKDKSLTVMREKLPFERSSHLMLRGDFRHAGPELEPGVIRVIASGADDFQPQPRETTEGRRTALAQWLFKNENPLTARVIANRVWQHHFGTGIVATPSEFGVMGTPPSNGPLLDWLATYLIEQNWSLKALHRKIVTSATYRQRSYLSQPATDSEQALWQASLQADPDASLLSRYPRWRLEGEAIRDAILLASGQLNLNAGGPGVRPPLPAELVGTLLKNQWDVTPDPAEHTRRSIYVFARRNLRYPIFEVFDRPSANASCPQRGRSTTAPQSLHLLNSEFSLQASQQLTALIQRTHPEQDAQIHAAFRRTLGRPPTAAETDDVKQFWAQQAEHAASAEQPLVHLCLSLFNCNEFVLVD